MTDTYRPHGADDYWQAFADLFPTGIAWPRDKDSVQQQLLRGLSGIWGDMDASASNLLLNESWPGSAVIMLPDWEANLGLPDACVPIGLSIQDRQMACLNKLFEQGGQSRDFFIGLAASIGFQIDIIEHSPFMVGISQVGNTLDWNGEGSIGPRWELSGLLGPYIRFYWTVVVLNPRLTWFRCDTGHSQCGVDTHLEIADYSELECVINRDAPAHTQPIYDFSGLAPIPALAGLP